MWTKITMLREEENDMSEHSAIPSMVVGMASDVDK